MELSKIISKHFKTSNSSGLSTAVNEVEVITEINDSDIQENKRENQSVDSVIKLEEDAVTSAFENDVRQEEIYEVEVDDSFLPSSYHRDVPLNKSTSNDSQRTSVKYFESVNDTLTENNASSSANNLVSNYNQFQLSVDDVRIAERLAIDVSNVENLLKQIESSSTDNYEFNYLSAGQSVLSSIQATTSNVYRYFESHLFTEQSIKRDDSLNSPIHSPREYQ